MASTTTGSDTVLNFSYDDLQLSVTPTQFAYNHGHPHHGVEPVAGTFTVHGAGGLDFGGHDPLGSGGNFTVVNTHDVRVNVTNLFGIGLHTSFDLHGSAAKHFIAHLDHAYHHGGTMT